MSGFNGTGGGELTSIVEAYEGEIERLLGELSNVEATRSQLVTLIAELVTLFSLHGGYMTHGEQQVLRRARELMEEVLG